VPISPTLGRELDSWTRDGTHVITYYGKAPSRREFFDRPAEIAGVTGGPNVIRHTVRTFLAEAGVPDAEADVFMGHKAEGSVTGKRYIHRRPEYLRRVIDGIETLFRALGGVRLATLQGTRMDRSTAAR
jgi:integrase